jgi:hypothetical protein
VFAPAGFFGDKSGRSCGSARRAFVTHRFLPFCFAARAALVVF